MNEKESTISLPPLPVLPEHVEEMTVLYIFVLIRFAFQLTYLTKCDFTLVKPCKHFMHLFGKQSDALREKTVVIVFYGSPNQSEDSAMSAI